ncbi:MAG: dihydropteroate synthase [Deltaproteobacteria bacterium]|nr:MAG: dihydropteroate synthase [Deltaproteobacteria bacterium]
MTTRTPHDLVWGAHALSMGRRTLIMGILNITPDSFSDGGRFLNRDTAIRHARQMVTDGVDILDIGGESTRPYADEVPEEEEKDRVIPVIEALAAHVDVPISIDTTKAAVAAAAIRAGASIINDISAMDSDPGMVEVAKETGVPVILMHMKGSPRTMQMAPSYDNVVETVTAYLEHRVAFAESRGIPRSHIILDPGIGFGKSMRHNLALLAHLSRICAIGLPVLVGTSRKSFIRSLLVDAAGEPPSADSPVVQNGTDASVVASVMNGAHIVRVHDVKQTAETLKVADAILEEKASLF